MSHYFQYLRIACEIFDNYCNGCKYLDKPCFLRQVLNSNNNYPFYSPVTWTIQDYNHIDKNKMAFLEGI